MTLKEVAKCARVSVATVSRTINDRKKVNPETAERVANAIRQLNYVPNLTARSLKTGRTNLIGLVVPDLIHSFFSELARGLTRVLRDEGFSVVISSSEEDPELEKKAIEHLLARGVDALLVASVQTSKEIFEKVVQRRVPCVLIDRLIPGVSADFIGVKDEVVGYMATGHLIQIGCRRIAHVSGQNISTAVGRLEGYKRALREHGMAVNPEYIVNADKLDESADDAGSGAATKLLALDSPPDGIFCFNDPVAIGAMSAILARGLRIPQDIALIGSGNLHFDHALRVPLSSVDQASEMMGQRAAMLAVGLIYKTQDSTRPKTVFLTPKLVVRDSTQKTP